MQLEQSVLPNATHLATWRAPHPRIEKLGGNSRQVSFNTDFDGLSRGFFKSKRLRTTTPSLSKGRLRTVFSPLSRGLKSLTLKTSEAFKLPQNITAACGALQRGVLLT